jgi:hypothetical protein
MAATKWSDPAAKGRNDLAFRIHHFIRHIHCGHTDLGGFRGVCGDLLVDLCAAGSQVIH